MSGESFRLFLDLVSVTGALFAVWKGGTAERIAAAILLANVAIGVTGAWLAPDSDGLIRLANDGLAAAALLVVTIRYGAPWMGGVMLFYAAQFSLHSYYLVTDRPPDYLYAAVNNINWSGTLWCLVIGAAVAWRRRVVAARGLAAEAAP
jgi:hypothetical protein